MYIADDCSCVSQGIDVTWESYKLEAYTQKFAETIFDFEEKVCVCVRVCGERERGGAQLKALCAFSLYPGG